MTKYVIYLRIILKLRLAIKHNFIQRTNEQSEAESNPKHKQWKAVNWNDA